jgi:cleavage and polyadenylation specificity factor subunit 2
MFTFTPLQGAKSDSTAVQSILELDGGVKVLVDVGWDETFDPQQLKELEKYASLLIASYVCPFLLTLPADKCRLSPSFFSLMRPSPTLAHSLIAASTCLYLRAFPSMRQHR